jgi:hypothetical protein
VQYTVAWAAAPTNTAAVMTSVETITVPNFIAVTPRLQAPWAAPRGAEDSLPIAILLM